MVLCAVERGPLERTVDGIKLSARSDLQHQLAVLIVFLNDAVAVAAHIYVVGAVNHAAVYGSWNRRFIAPGGGNVAARIEFDDRWRRDRRLLFLVGDIAPVDHVNVVATIDAHASELAGNPTLGQVFGPGRINCKLGGVKFGGILRVRGRWHEHGSNKHCGRQKHSSHARNSYSIFLPPR